MTFKKIFFIAILATITSSGFAQTKPDSNNLPTYIIISANPTPKLFGGLELAIDTKNSKKEIQLEELQKYLESKKDGVGVRNLIDLFNSMYDLGFEYVNAFEASSFSVSTVEKSVSSANQDTRSNIVFKKILSK